MFARLVRPRLLSLSPLQLHVQGVHFRQAAQQPVVGVKHTNHDNSGYPLMYSSPSLSLALPSPLLQVQAVHFRRARVARLLESFEQNKHNQGQPYPEAKSRQNLTNPLPNLSMQPCDKST